jgi:hypothetical protein
MTEIRRELNISTEAHFVRMHDATANPLARACCVELFLT